MTRSITPRSVARDGRILCVPAVCRISTVNQDESSLDALGAMPRRASLSANWRKFIDQRISSLAAARRGP